MNTIQQLKSTNLDETEMNESAFNPDAPALAAQSERPHAISSSEARASAGHSGNPVAEGTARGAGHARGGPCPPPPPPPLSLPAGGASGAWPGQAGPGSCAAAAVMRDAGVANRCMRRANAPSAARGEGTRAEKRSSPMAGPRAQAPCPAREGGPANRMPLRLRDARTRTTRTETASGAGRPPPHPATARSLAHQEPQSFGGGYPVLRSTRLAPPPAHPPPGARARRAGLAAPAPAPAGRDGWGRARALSAGGLGRGQGGVVSPPIDADAVPTAEAAEVRDQAEGPRDDPEWVGGPGQARIVASADRGPHHVGQLSGSDSDGPHYVGPVM
jgi:hypothetical protein